MLKNLVIALQSLLILVGIAIGIAWYDRYQSTALQIHTLTHFASIANETRFLIRIHRRLEAGETATATRNLAIAIENNKEDLRKTWAQLDLTLNYPGQLADARKYASILEDVGISEFSDDARARLVDSKIERNR